MSSHGYQDSCPNCSNSLADFVRDSSPVDHITMECLECGFYSVIRVGIMPLDDVNELRLQRDLKPLDLLDLSEEYSPILLNYPSISLGDDS